MGALGHYLETMGVPSTQISLIREHTETIRPPRALWVPFELGRPLGLPGNPDFQKQVVLAALELLVLEKGPVLADFPDDISEKTGCSQNSLDQLACPVSFARPSTEKTGTEKLVAAFRQEIAEFHSWYDIGRKKRGYSAVIYFPPDGAFRLFTDFMQGNPLKFLDPISSPALALRFAAQDLKAFYFESVMFRPDLTLPDDSGFNRWFWQKTVAGNVLKAVREKCRASNDKSFKMTGEMLLVPLDQV